MKQTNNAIKFLMAQYRAIFNNAYFKGLATAALVTVAMAAGQAQAADGDLADFIKGSSKTDVKGDFTLSKKESISGSAGGYLTNLTIANGGNLEFDGSTTANTDHLRVKENVIVEKGGILTLKGQDGKGQGLHGTFDESFDDNPNSKLQVNGGTLNITQSMLQINKVELNDAIVNISKNINVNSNSDWEDNAMLGATLAGDKDGNIIAGTGVLSVTGNSAITLDSGSQLYANTLNLEGGKIDMKGTETAGSGSIIRGFSYQSNLASVNVNGTDINVNGSGNYIVAHNINLTGAESAITVSGTSVLHLSGDLNKKKNLSDADVASATTVNLNGATLNINNTGSLIVDNADSVFNATSGTINNSGEITFNNKEVNTTAALLAGMAGGKITMASGGEINVTSGAVDLSTAGLKIIKDDGTVDNNKLVLSEATTLNAADLTLGKAFKASNLTLNADALKVGEGFTQNIGTITVANSLSGSKGFTVDSNSAAAVLNLKNAGADAATISGIETLTVKATDNTATLNIEGNWSGLDAAAVVVASGGTINLKGVDALTFKSVDVQANGKLALDGSNLTVADAVKNGKADGVSLSNNSSVSASYAKVASGDTVDDSTIKNFKLDGTSKIVLTGRAEGVIEKTKLDAIKKALLGADGQGLVEIAGASLSDADAGITGDTAAFDKAQGNSGVSGIYEDKTIVGANAAVTGSNSWGSVELADTKDNLEIASGASVTLNGVGGELVTKKDGTTNGGVALTQDATLSIVGNGTLATITASEKEKGKALVNAGLTVTGDIGSSTATLGEVNVQGNGQLNTTGNIFTKALVADGAVSTTKDITATSIEANAAVQAKNITAETIKVSDSLTADKITLTKTSSSITVGNEQDTGLLEVGTLDLAGGKLLLDPAYDQPSTIVALKDVTDTTKDVVSANGDIGVGMNSILAVGTTAADAKALLTKLDFFNGEALKQTNGAVLVANESLYIANDNEVILDSTATNADLTTALSGNNTFKLGTGSALVVTENLTSKTSDGSKAIIEFETSTSAKVTLEKDSQLAFESALSEQDKVTLSNATAQNTTNNGVVITAAGGLLNGTLTGSQISFTLDEDKLREQAVNMSAPVQDLAIAALKGTKGEVVLGEAGTQYIQTMTGLDGGKAVEETARLAVYGGAVQATNLAQQAATDAVADRMSRANPNGSLVFADNAQGGGLWLSPVYKSHESDSFDADGVDYGVDADLTGLVLGGDFTSESGVRAGAYFNFGSASIDGQGVGDKVSNDADYFGFGLYTGMTFGQMSLVADAGFTQVSNDIEQTPSAKISKVKADVDSSAVTLGLRGEYKLNVATMDVTPHLGVRYTRLAVDGYDAKADGYTVATTDVDTMQMFSIPFGVSISKNIVAGSWTVKPVFDLTLTANAGDTDAKLDTTFVGTKTIGLTSEAFDSFTYGATVGIDAKYGENFSVGLNTNYVGSSNTDEFGVMGNVRYMF